MLFKIKGGYLCKHEAQKLKLDIDHRPAHGGSGMSI